MLTLGSSSTFEASALAAAASSATHDDRNVRDRSGGGRAYISVADEGEESENIFT
jgi:hypothetical protein